MGSLAGILEEARIKASEAALTLIRETPSWDKCDPHSLYYKTEAEILKPHVERAVLHYAGHFEVDQYLEGLITGREFLSALVLKTGQTSVHETEKRYATQGDT